jgi:hypothetical protein
MPWAPSLSAYFVPTSLIVLALCAPLTSAHAQNDRSPEAVVEIEGLRLTTTVNNLQRPNNSLGDKVSVLPFADNAQNGTRITLELPLETVGKGHQLRLVYAPYRSSGTATPANAFRYDRVSFSANTPVDAAYKFDSYRITYSLPLSSGTDWDIRYGGTLAIRDARTRFTQGSTNADFKNRGVVPLLYLAGRYSLAQDWTLIGDVDAIASPVGSLLDTSMRLSYGITPQLSATIGLRYLTGGAKADEFYNFIRVRALTMGVRLNF